MVHIVTVNGKPWRVFSNKRTAYEHFEEVKERYDKLFEEIRCMPPGPYGVVSMKVEEG